MVRKNNIRYFLIIFLIIFTNCFLFFLFTSGHFSLHQSPPTIKETSKKLTTSCGTGQKSTVCYQEQFIKLAKQYDIGYITDVVLSLQQNSSLGNCHLVAHLVGQVEMKKNIKNFNGLLQQVNPNLCTGGFIHGILEEYSRITKINQITPAIVEQICNAVRPSDPKGINCMHTMGHLIYLNANGDLKKAVKVCDTVSPGIEHKNYQCYLGLFMEHTTKLNMVLHGFKFDPYSITDNDISDMKNICNSVRNYAAESCWEEISRLFLMRDNNNTITAFRDCTEASTDEYRKDCQMYLGMLTIGSSKNMTDGIHQYCNFYSDMQEKNDCQLLLLSTVLFNTPTNAPSAIAFCKTLPANSQRSCFLKIGSTLALMLPDAEIIEYCKKAPKKFFASCTLENV